jgi:hypothetical protein
VAEPAAAVDRPMSTVAHHVNLLVLAGMLRIVRTRRVRAIDERYYGHIIHVGVGSRRCPSRRRADSRVGFDNREVVAFSRVLVVPRARPDIASNGAEWAKQVIDAYRTDCSAVWKRRKRDARD